MIQTLLALERIDRSKDIQIDRSRGKMDWEGNLSGGDESSKRRR